MQETPKPCSFSERDFQAYIVVYKFHARVTTARAGLGYGTSFTRACRPRAGQRGGAVCTAKSPPPHPCARAAPQREASTTSSLRARSSTARGLHHLIPARAQLHSAKPPPPHPCARAAPQREAPTTESCALRVNSSSDKPSTVTRSGYM